MYSRDVLMMRARTCECGTCTCAIIDTQSVADENVVRTLFVFVWIKFVRHTITLISVLFAELRVVCVCVWFTDGFECICVCDLCCTRVVPTPDQIMTARPTKPINAICVHWNHPWFRIGLLYEWDDGMTCYFQRVVRIYDIVFRCVGFVVCVETIKSVDMCS